MTIIIAFVIWAALAAGGYMWYKRRRECPPQPVTQGPSKESTFFERYLPKPTSGQSGEPL